MNFSGLMVKLLFSLLVGGLIGAEREFHDKSAGFRTLIFICVGSTLFTILSLELGSTANDPVRIAASIVTGVGFLGAGVILHHGERVSGLTTASTIWLTAALGMGIGGGQYLLAGTATGVILAGLWFLPVIDRLIHKTRETFTYHVVFPTSLEKFNELDSIFPRCNLRVDNCKRSRKGEVMTCSWQVHGFLKDHERLVQTLFADDSLVEFRY